MPTIRPPCRAIKSLALTLPLAACASAGPPRPPAAPSAQVTAVADEYLAGYFETNPSAATQAGVRGARHDRLEDNTPAAREAWERREDRWLADLQAVDATALRGTTAWVTHGLLLEALASARQARVCRRDLQPASWVAGYSTLATIQPVGSDSLRRSALARWAQLPRFLDAEIANARQGLRLGYSVPKDVVRRDIARLDGVLALPPDRSPFFSPAQRDSTPAFRAAFDTLVRARLVPAMRRYRDFLADEYLPAARDAIGVAANPDGAACYRALIRRSATIDRDPREIHQLGLARMDTVQREMRELAARSFGDTVLPRVFERLRTDSQYTFRSREHVVALADSAIARAKLAMPRWFGILPKSDVRVEPFPTFLERGAAPGQYQAAPDDGSRPGTYRVNAFQPERRSRGDMEDVTFHEASPGHHLQIAIARERTGVHPVTRYLGNSGFSEGWGLYSERLADEMGLYSSDLGRMGMLSGEAFRAARLVVDAGIHALGWSRQQAIDYMVRNTTAPPEQVAAEVDRYMATPGQATAYMLGMLEIRRLRTQAERALGTRFDIRQFHDRVLEDGGVTLPMLDAKITRWLETSRGG